MAFRLDKAVIRGEISNQERNRVTGKIWILGKKQPLVIDLQGNCLRDLAGCRLVFRNPKPKAEPLVESLALEQSGTVGDMTASRKTKVPTVADDELMRLLHEKKTIPYLLANTLYLEWFSTVNGRVVIETGDFQLEISEPIWMMTAEEEQVQSLESQENFYEFLNQLTGVTSTEEEDDDFLADDEEEDESDVEDSFLTSVESESDLEQEEDLEDEPLDEFQWEQELREADRRAEAFQEAFDRYKEHPDRERLIAEAMGWDAEEADSSQDNWEAVADSLMETDPLDSMDDAAEEEDEEDSMEPHHPLSRRAMHFALKLQQDAESMGILSADKDVRENPLLSVIVSIISLGGKLAAALDSMAMGFDTEPGFVVAMLKRAQVPLNEAMHSLSSIDGKSFGKDVQMWLATARSELFDMRKDILDVMKEQRQRQQ
jgi:hypothetical protein